MREKILSRYISFLLGLLMLYGCEQKEVKKTYYSDGSIKAQAELVDGKRNGVMVYYYSNGKVQAELPYINDKANGLAIYYSMSGRVSKKITYSDGRKNGEYEIYYSNGRIAEKGKFYNDLKAGKILQYFEDSTTLMEEYFMLPVNSGEEIYYKKSFDRKGNLVEAKKYLDVLLSSDTVSSNEDFAIDVKIPDRINFDSAILIWGDYSSDFVRKGKLDTAVFLDHHVKIIVNLRNKGLNAIRGECIIYKREYDSDSTYEYSTSRHFEEYVFAK